MSVKTNQNGQIIKPEITPVTKMTDMIYKYTGEFARVLPRHVTPDRLTRIVATAIRVTPKLAECTPISFVGSVMQSAQLGLEPNTMTGHSYLVPFRNSKRNVMECTLIIGYQGMIELALRSGKVGSLIAYAVREGDQFYFRYGLDPQCDHIPSSDSGRDSLPLTHTYAVASVGTSKLFEVLSREQIDARRKRSSSAKRGFSPWDTDYESMARKSAIRALYKYLPKSHEITTAIALDVAAETYKPQSHAYDPQLADMLHSKGLLDDTEDNIVDEGSENA